MKFTLFDLENWREIGVTLARNKTRTFLTAFGIFWGTAILSMLWGGSEGLRGMMMRNFKGTATNMGGIFPSRTTMSYKGFNKGLWWTLDENDMRAVRAITPHLEYSAAVGTWSAVISYKGKTTSNFQMQGVESDYSRIQIPLMYEGRFINDADEANKLKVAVMGKSIADQLFSGESPVGKYVSVNGVYFLVVGVVGQASEATFGANLDETIVIPGSTMQRAFNRRNSYDFFVFTAEKGYSPADLKPYIFRAIRTNHPIHPDDTNAIGLMNAAEIFETIGNMFMGLNILALFVGGGTLIAGIIGVGNIMWIIVKERTREIGVRRAIGAKPRDIMSQILAEGMALTAVAGMAGICFAAVVLAIVDSVTYDPMMGSAHFQLAFTHAMAILATFLVLGSLAGTIPAIRALRIKPIEALNDK